MKINDLDFEYMDVEAFIIHYTRAFNKVSLSNNNLTEGMKMKLALALIDYNQKQELKMLLKELISRDNNGTKR